MTVAEGKKNDNKTTGEVTGSLTYARLREWYLATLRKRIISRMESSHLSPAAQIAADRQAIERLILGTATADETRTLPAIRRTVPLQELLYASAFIPVLTQLLFVVLILSGIRPLSPFWLVALGLLLAIIASVALVIIFRKLIIIPLISLAAASGVQAALSDTKCDIILVLEQAINRLNKSISQAAKREQSIADYAPDLICAFDLNGKFAAVSPSCAEFCGYSEIELIGNDLRNFVVSDDLDKTEMFLKAMPEASGAVPFENRFKRGNGKIIDISWLVEWSKTEQSLFCVGRDISSQRQLERIKQEFVSMVSHDLKTPINSVAGTLELLEEGGVGTLSPEGLLLVKNARKSTSSILNLINDLLDLEKMEEGKLLIRSKPVSLAGVLEAAIQSVLFLAKASALTIKAEFKDAIVMADEQRLMQVVVNMLTNAIKYSPEGGVIVISSSSAKGIVIIAITDEGPGIPTAYQDTVFERFVQLNVDGNKEGAGLGLAICRAIITAHGGTIGLRSEPGSGSTFWFTVPLSRATIGAAST